MKKVLLFLFYVFAFLVEWIEVLGLPILFLILGLSQQMPWQYYAITIGGYFGLLLLLEGLVHLIFKLLGRKRSGLISRKAAKYRTRFSAENENSLHLPKEDN